ncbi:MAG: DUF4956 domain-containing protein [Eubacteriales bacterium]
MINIENIKNILGDTELNVLLMLAIMGSALVCGILLAILYMFNNRREGYSRGMATTLIILPMIIAVVVLLVNGNWAVGLTLAGVFTIIRFRTTQSDPKDLCLIFTSLASGLACGMGLVFAGFILTVLICIVMIVLSLIGFGTPRVPALRLKITIPESLNYVGVFDEVFTKYAKSWHLEKVKSSNFGTMFELSYQIVFKKGINQKEFMDDLRTLNGNLNIMLQDYVYAAQ